MTVKRQAGLFLVGVPSVTHGRAGGRGVVTGVCRDDSRDAAIRHALEGKKKEKVRHELNARTHSKIKIVMVVCIRLADWRARTLLTLQIVQQVGEEFVRATRFIVNDEEFLGQGIVFESQDLQLEQLAHLIGQDTEEVVVEQEFPQQDKITDLTGQGSQLVGREVQVLEAGEAIDLRRQLGQVVVVQVEAGEVGHLPEGG